MIVYHVDKFGRLMPGQTIEQTQLWSHADSARQERLNVLNRLYRGRLTFFGVQSLDDFPDKAHDLEMTELVMDYVRALCYPQLPSRLTVLFASRTVEDATQWSLPLVLRDCESQLVALDTSGSVYAANAQFRDEVNSRIAALFEKLRARPSRKQWACLKTSPRLPVEALGSTCLVQCVEPALAYWESLTPVHAPRGLPLYQKEELLLVPPVKVIGRVEP